MKRSPMPARTSPLVTKTPLRRTALPATPLSRSAKHHNRPKRRDTGPTQKVRDLVHRRSEGWCEWPGCWLVAADIHHRLNRKDGGRHGEMSERINQAAWLLHACRPHHEAVTSPFGAARDLAREMGWLLHEGEDAREVPVSSRHGDVRLVNDGTYVHTKEAA